VRPYLEELKSVIEELHGTHAKYVETVPVKEEYEGETIWEGEVEVFELENHPDASRIFAWAYDYEDDKKPTQHVTVLQIPPATTPENAVRAAIVSEHGKDRIH
jgi:hypothetical protein